MFQNVKIYIFILAKQDGNPKMSLTFNVNKFTIEETIYKQTCITLAIFL